MLKLFLELRQSMSFYIGGVSGGVAGAAEDSTVELGNVFVHFLLEH